MRKLLFFNLLFIQIFHTQLNAQVRFAVADYEVINEHIEFQHVIQHPIYKISVSLFDSIKLQVMPFITKEMEWVVHRCERSKLSPEELQLLENYCNYLRTEILGLEEDYIFMEKVRDDKVTLFVEQYSSQLIRLHARQTKINLVMKSSEILYQDDKTIDLTKSVLDDLIKNKDAFDIDIDFVKVVDLIDRIYSRMYHLLAITYYK